MCALLLHEGPQLLEDRLAHGLHASEHDDAGRLQPLQLGGEQAVSKPVFEKLRDFVK